MITLTLLLTFVLGMIPASPEEGMYPLSEIDKVDLQKAGLKIESKEVYNPNGVSLVDALVQLSGCTGSFISESGLIITNHHCAFGAISRASTVEKNYLENGFYAGTQSGEIPSQGYTCKITESYLDVSDIILGAVKNVTDPAQRTKVISDKMRELSEDATNEKESIVATVSEMFAGKSYVLFKYRIIRDVRLVYAPPQSIGNFGGETDNWVWPRHTGDFSIMRAYVAPDGSAATYSKDNVPYKPKRFLKINPNGVEEGDFVFMLGYPGRTYRHRPSEYMKYQVEYQLPYISNLYEYAIETMKELSSGNKELTLAFASRIKGLANTMKNYQGKMKGLKKIGLVEQKQQEEKLLQQFINSDPALKSKYGNLLKEIHTVFEMVNQNALTDLWLRQVVAFSPTLSKANFLLTYSEEMRKPESERSVPYQDKNIKQTLSRMEMSAQGYNAAFEETMLMKMLMDANSFGENSRIAAVDDILEGNGIHPESTFQEFIINSVINSKIREKDFFESLLKKTPQEIAALQDPLFIFAKKIKMLGAVSEKENQITEGKLNKLYGDLVDVKMQWKKTMFIPDANSTLRLTYGYIKGYNPSDAVYMEPFTSVDGVIEKGATGAEEFDVPDKLRAAYDKKDFGKYVSKKTGKLVVDMLYDMDTTGGNSGSPVLDAYGNLIGVNFDRAFEATINDFAWNESYSRSIGVDIRYVLWVMDKVGGANNLLKEIGIN
ncbi:MAG: S46 family peptidase [Ignavibacteriae bacterium HGW-Ignavibacteriae-3]|nr:MAG: S46 family peptidase [Ignavibacteriae bacterium HGW-Ignavibacteriae-3]